MNDLYGPHISVIDPISPAIDRVKAILFRPFDPEKWFVIGFCAWLAGLCEGGGGGRGGFSNRSGGFSPSDVGPQMHEHLPIIIIVGATIMLIGLAVGIACLWVGSRGRFMFLHCVARNVAEVRVPWRRYRVQGNSLFLFRLAVGFVFLLFAGLLVGTGVLVGVTLAQGGDNKVGIILVVVVGLLLLIPIGIVYGVVSKFTKDFVVPIMYLRNGMCMESWREFTSILSLNKGRFAVYILFHILLDMGISMIVLGVFLATCCIACCISAIPYIGTVLMLPLLVFLRAYSLHYLAQYSPEYDVFRMAALEGGVAPEYPPSPDVQGL